jgi:signal transduction histidine kinase
MGDERGHGTMTATPDIAQQMAVHRTPEPELLDLALSSESPDSDSHAVPRRTDIDSTWLRVRELVRDTDVQPRVPELGTKRANGTAMHPVEHVVRLYETDAFLLDSVATFCGDAILAGGVAIFVATAEHREGIADRLRARGLFDDACPHESYIELDAAETLSRFMVNGEVDAARFMEVIGGIVSRAGEGGRQVRVFGEMVSVLVADGNPTAAVRLEELWNDLQVQAHPTHAFSLFCAYPMYHFAGEAQRELFSAVCAAHSQVVPAESFTALPSSNDRLRGIAELQQKAKWLEEEIAQRQLAEERLRVALAAEHEARLDAEAALHVRDEFLSTAAHELRNPLACLSLHAQVALQWLSHNEHLDLQAARTEHSLRSICGQAARLSRLLDRLLDVSRLEADYPTLHLQRRPTDLTALVALEVINTQARSDGHQITLQAPQSLTAWVDPIRLEQVLANLLDNAIKHSPHGEPIVVTLSQPMSDTLELTVSDRGVGIPIEARDRIFERFFQARSDDATRGLGLGLYVSRKIVELHRGQIRADFSPDGGTRFVVTLPVGVEALVASHAAD